LDFQSAKKFLNALFGREKRPWSREEDELLLAIVPIHAGDVPLIRAWFTLSSFHPVFERTKRKQELTTFLRDFNGELDKIKKFAPCFMDSVAGVEKEEPPKWREFFKWKYSPDVRLPASFRELDPGLRQEYANDFRCFVKEQSA
jgi:hypothetical protein